MLPCELLIFWKLQFRFLVMLHIKIVEPMSETDDGTGRHQSRF